jgi:regulator of protease activity HflC (stomatin/prohibitin superfamily)
LLANGIASVVESIYQYRVGIIKARGDAQVERIKAESQAKAMLMRTEARVRLLDAGLDPQLHELAIALLRQQSLDATMSDGPRLDSDDLAVLLGKPTGTGTGNPPDRGQGTYPSFLMAGRS